LDWEDFAMMLGDQGLYIIPVLLIVVLPFVSCRRTTNKIALLLFWRQEAERAEFAAMGVQ